MKKTGELDIRGTLVRVVKINGEDYVSLTDMAKLKSEDAQQTISNWMRNRMIWQKPGNTTAITNYGDGEWMYSDPDLFKK